MIRRLLYVLSYLVLGAVGMFAGEILSTPVISLICRMVALVLWSVGMGLLSAWLVGIWPESDR